MFKEHYTVTIADWQAYTSHQLDSMLKTSQMLIGMQYAKEADGMMHITLFWRLP